MSILLGGKTPDELGIKVLIDTKEPMLPETRDQTVEVPGRHGVVDYGAYLGARVFEFPCAVVESTSIGLQQAVRLIAQHLVDNTGRPRMLELIINTEPDKTYQVRYSGSLSIQRLVGLGQFVLTLTAFDPFAYGPEQILETTTSSNNYHVARTTTGTISSDVVITLTNIGGNVIHGFTLTSEILIN